MATTKKKVVTVVGGGASAHVLIPFLSGAGHEVNILTRKPTDWATELSLQYQSIDGALLEEFPGALAKPVRIRPMSSPRPTSSCCACPCAPTVQHFTTSPRT